MYAILSHFLVPISLNKCLNFFLILSTMGITKIKTILKLSRIADITNNEYSVIEVDSKVFALFI